MWYLIQMTFIFKGTTEASSLDCYRRGKKAVDEQIAYNRGWLTARGHTETSCVVTPVGKEKPF